MIRQDPILIAAPPRSGTTMLAGLLYYHGVWVGRARTSQYPWTNSNFGSENIDIKAVLKDMAIEMGYTNWDTPFPNPVGFDQEQNKRRIESFIPENTPWLVKSSWCLVFWEFWKTMYPNARWVFASRDTLKIVDSMNRHPGMTRHPDGEKHQYIAHLFRAASRLIDERVNYIMVDMERLADRDPEVIDDLFCFLELKPDYDTIKNWIKPEMLKR